MIYVLNWTTGTAGFLFGSVDEGRVLAGAPLSILLVVNI